MLDTNIFEEILEYEADYRLIKTLVAAQKIHLTITPIQIAELCRTGDVNPAKWDSLSPDEKPAYLQWVQSERERREKLLMLSFLLCELVEAAQESSDDMRIAGAASQFLVTEDIRITNRVRLAYPVLKALNYLEFLELFISLEK